MKIATYNINNVVRRLPNLLQWLEASEPDVVCLQELKATDNAFPIEAVRAAGYHAVWCGQPSWNGVAILARGAAPILTRASLPGNPADRQARYIEAAIRGVLIGCLYLPNGNPQPGPKFDYKLAWFERLIIHSADLRRLDVPAVLAGDYNVVPTNADIYSTRSWTKSVASTRTTRSLRTSTRPGLDRRLGRHARRTRSFHLLAISPQRLGARRGVAAGSPSTQPAIDTAAWRERRRSLGSRATKRQRSCPSLGRSEMSG